MFKNRKINTISFNLIENSPKILDIGKFNINEKIESKYKNIIVEFSQKILNLKSINFSYLYNNLRTLKTQNIGSLIKENARAAYSVKYNLIVFKDFFEKNEVMHELLHLSSGIYDSKKNIEFCGFSQSNYKYGFSVGTGLNEGYTEYLNEHIFNNKYNVYIIEKNIAKCIEMIIGNIEMKKLFFKADLKELILRLSQYNSLNETMDFLCHLDYVNEKSIDFFSKKRDKQFNYCLKFCVKYLIYSFINKLNHSIELKEINKDEYNLYLDKFLDTLGSFNYYEYNNEYFLRFISEKEIIKILNKVKRGRYL